MEVKLESESVQIIKLSFGDLVIRLKANNIALNSAVYRSRMLKANAP